MLAATACLPLAMLLGSHLISRRLDLGAIGDAELTPRSLEQLTGMALGWLAAAIMLWLLLGMLLALLATLSIRSGHRRLGAKIARLVPGFMARLCVAAIGGSLLLATSANAAAPHAQMAQQLAGQTADPEATTAAEPRGEIGDGAGAAAAEPTVLSPGWLPQRISLPLQRTLGGGTRPSQEVVVRPGDTLWSIAARHLAPESTAGDIAESWPQWYAANRELIGPNPDSLDVGMVLTEPNTRSTRP
ncbi:LysM peptidoglycan-binding domain-containing protein [Paeniglutamicibacter kerguelensis]|uniref:Nucleoid-associated protein YgaU n=1 Tax=Paeniglutamicibacter kerguelensis TaxID=254788 RepID=A0ABS4XE71_9MICC|nr:LysM domain-containing protein [Paeniglutamicibacter kerguelensis]MBP2386671.1 nucleoid-associated protein YgaU [Paeniglutamicibacter kerguelensis]